jgi:hypothetical protein
VWLTLVVRPALEVRPTLVMRPALPPSPCVSRLRCVCLIQHDRDVFGLLGAGAKDFTQCEPA